MKPKAVGYIRVSTDAEKQANSMAVQPEQIRAYAAMQGFELAEIVADEISALKVPFFERPGGGRILEMIEAENIQHVIAAKVDRVFRDASDGLDTAGWMRAHGISLHVLDQGGFLDLGHENGRLMFTVLLGIAEYEPRRISRRTREALDVLRKNGKRTGKIPLGFIMQDGALVRDEQEMAIVDEIRERAASGGSYLAIARDLNTRGVPTKEGGRWHASVVKYIAKNDRLYNNS